MNKKAQAAMEFLMTYGWAILVVIAAIAALAYFGVLNPSKFMPEQCILAPGIACLDFKITTSEIDLILVNSLGRDIELTGITIGDCNDELDTEFDNGDQIDVTLSCDNGNLGSKFKQDVIIEYVNADSNLSKTLKGSLSGMIQE